MKGKAGGGWCEWERSRWLAEARGDVWREDVGDGRPVEISPTRMQGDEKENLIFVGERIYLPQKLEESRKNKQSPISMTLVLKFKIGKGL